MKTARQGRDKGMLLPPLWDHHGHIGALGALSDELDFRDAASPDALLKLLEDDERKREPGEWITGFGWDQNLWNGLLPSLEQLDTASRGRPLFLKRIDCHAAMVNSRAMEMAGLKTDSAIPGGEFVYIRGKWTGIVLDNAMNPFFRAMPPPAKKVVRRRIRAALRTLAASGLSGATDMQLREIDVETLSEMDGNGDLELPVAGYLEWTPGMALPARLCKGRMFALEGIKVFLDGALGSRGAALRKPYSDDKATRGLLILDRKEIKELLEEAGSRKIPVAFHAIGDRALETFLSAYETIRRPAPKIRLEHLQVTPSPLLTRLLAADVTVSLQPCHLLSDRGWAGERLGPARIKRSYLLGSLIRGKRYLLGTDFPIEPPDPARTIAGCFDRPDRERITLNEAIRGMACPVRFRKFGRGAVLYGMTPELLRGDPAEIRLKVDTDG
ncbi:MAG TPA: amidohydrolase family protein [Acidobacteriota bacterium]|nr:amidohydrolase family protein [Acidobacteriota bacterium]HQO18921.1 amidohydrolase family protein [Acidobacteriota bacterium]HQQ46419.1 amidohydrolase family protein [Acidobacteriota bacterium]